MKRRHLFSLLWRSPAEAYQLLLTSKAPVRTGCLLMLFPIAGYTLMYIFLTIAQGAPSVFTPWLNIERDEYYAMNRWLLAPSMLLAWIASSGLMQMLAGALDGSGSFEKTLLAAAFSICVAMFFGLLHDLPMSACSAIGWIDARQHEVAMNEPTLWRTLLWIFYSLYGLGFLILFPLAVRTVHNLSFFRATLVGFAGFLLFQTVFLVFNR